MDDYNVNVLSEAKNEYSSRLVTILSPLVNEITYVLLFVMLVFNNENDN